MAQMDPQGMAGRTNVSIYMTMQTGGEPGKLRRAKTSRKPPFAANCRQLPPRQPFAGPKIGAPFAARRRMAPEPIAPYTKASITRQGEC